jgi:hypothetical protein
MAKILQIDLTSLSEDKAKTYLTADITSGTILTVQSVNGFSGSVNILLGDIGQEDAEIIAIHSLAQASGTTLYLNSSVGKAHSINTPVYAIDWNQVEITHGTVSTTSGISSTLTYGTNILPDRVEMSYKDTSKTSGYYFIRFVDTVGSGYSDYSDAIPYGGFAYNTVWSIKDRALKKVNAKIDDIITHDFLNNCLWEARREFHKAPGKRPFRRKFNVDLGDVTTGSYSISLPNDVENPTSAENIYAVRIGQNIIVTGYDKKDFDRDYRDVAHTTLSSAYATADVYMVLTNSRDFDSSGSVYIESDTISYSANEVSTGSLTIDTAGTYDHTANSDVWQGISMGLPMNYIVLRNPGESAFIYFNAPFETAYNGQNIWSDYYRTLVPYDSDADELDEPDYDMYVHYLAYRIRKALSPDLNDQKDPDYLEWLIRKQNALQHEYLGTEISFYPNLPF